MPGLAPGIHVLTLQTKTWMAGTSPAMTVASRCSRHADLPRQAHPAADPDTVLRVGDHLFAAAAAARRPRDHHGGRGARSGGDRADSRAVPARPADPGSIR